MILGIIASQITITTVNTTVTGVYDKIKSDGYHTPAGSMSTSSGVVSTEVYDSMMGETNTGISLGYQIYKDGTLKMSGTTSGFTLSSTQRGYLNGTGQVRVACTTAGNTIITNRVKLALVYTY